MSVTVGCAHPPDSILAGSPLGKSRSAVEDAPVPQTVSRMFVETPGDVVVAEACGCMRLAEISVRLPMDLGAKREVAPQASES